MWSLGSKILLNGFGCSPRKNSSGVLNCIPTFAAKSLVVIVSSRTGGAASRILLPVRTGVILEHLSIRTAGTASSIPNEDGVVKV